MKRHSQTIFVLLITAIFFVVTGCMDIVKTEEDMEKKTESSTTEQTEQPKEEKAVAGKEEVAGAIKEEKIEDRSIKESSLSARVETKTDVKKDTKADAMKELTAMAEKEGKLATVYFEFDSSTVRDEMKLVLDNNIEWLKKRQDVRIELQGHADEKGTSEYNIALGERRAHSIKKYIVDSGLSEAILSTISYGEERPADLGHTEEALAKNRRVEFVIVKKR